MKQVFWVLSLKFSRMTYIFIILIIDKGLSC